MNYRVGLLLAAVALSFGVMTTAAQAQATRTWVSGVGDDANPCSRTAPCKTFAGAVSKTADCGEIDALDPAGYGAVTLTKGIKIDGGGGEAGQVASILAPSGGIGIVVNNSSSACPMNVIRNLDINGVGAAIIGINVVAGGTLALENVDIENFTQQCVRLQPSTAVGLTAYNTNFERCGQGGLVTSTTTGTERVVITHSHFSKNTGAAGIGTGVIVGTNSKVAIIDSDIANNIGGGVTVGGTAAFLQLQHVMISNNQAFGVRTSTGGLVTMSDSSVVFNNGPGLDTSLGGTINTWNNNYVNQNNPDGARSGTIAPM
jgi:hypothetical protein